MRTRRLLRNVCYRAIIMSVSSLHTRLIHFSPLSRMGTCLCKSIVSKNIQSDMNYIQKCLFVEGSSGFNGWDEPKYPSAHVAHSYSRIDNHFFEIIFECELFIGLEFAFIALWQRFAMQDRDSQGHRLDNLPVSSMPWRPCTNLCFFLLNINYRQIKSTQPRGSVPSTAEF